MARKCGSCGNLGHNRRTCPAISKGKQRDSTPDDPYKARLIRPKDTDCPYQLGQRIAVEYPWQNKLKVGIIDSIDYKTKGVYLHDEKDGKSYGFNWHTLDKYKIRVEILAHGQKLKRRRKKRPNPEEE